MIPTSAANVLATNSTSLLQQGLALMGLPYRPLDPPATETIAGRELPDPELNHELCKLLRLNADGRARHRSRRGEGEGAPAFVEPGVEALPPLDVPPEGAVPDTTPVPWPSDDSTLGPLFLPLLAEVATTTTTTAATTTTTTAGPPPYILTLPRIANAEQARAVLRHFERNFRHKLPQAAGPGKLLLQLGRGSVRFATVADMVTTFPCAQTVTAHRPRRFFGRRLPPWAQHFYSAEYPRLPKGQGRAVREGLVDGQVAITATRFRNEVSFSPDELRWVPTGVYTDPDIEREKLHMWGRILNWAYAVATQDPDDHHWVTIVKRSRGLGAGGLE